MMSSVVQRIDPDGAVTASRSRPSPVNAAALSLLLPMTLSFLPPLLFSSPCRLCRNRKPSVPPEFLFDSQSAFLSPSTALPSPPPPPPLLHSFVRSTVAEFALVMETTQTSSLFSPLRPPLPTPPTLYHPRLFHLPFDDFPRSSLVTRASPSSQAGYRGVKPQRDWIAEWVSKNDGFVRIMPILVGGVSLVAVLLNRAFSGIAPVADASSSQSRADILTLSLAVTDILTGLVWLSIRPKYISPVAPSGVECKRIKPGITSNASCELLWFWESLSTATCCKSLVVVFGNECLLQIGAAAKSSERDESAVAVDIKKLTQGSLYKNCMQSSKQSYLANLSLYPGRSELPFLPNNTQAVILQPIGDRGIAIIGGDTIRGFTATDQAWISMVAEKLDATLSKFVEAVAEA